MPTGKLTTSIDLGGLSFQRSVSRTFDHPNVYQVDLSPGKALTNWVKTDANTAAADLPSGHGYSNGKFDIYWTESSVPKVRYGVDGTITTNALALDGGAGDDFPASATTGMVACKVQTINTTIDGDNIKLIGIVSESTTDSSTARAHLDFLDGSSATVAEVDLVANVPRSWDVEGGDTNAFTGNVIESCRASNGSTSETLTLKIMSGEDSTP